MFGTLHSFPITSKYIHEQNKKLQVMETTQNDLANLQAEQRIITASKSSIPPSVKNKLSPETWSAYTEKRNSDFWKD